MSQAAFALKADRDLDCVGAIVVNPQRSINVRELLEENSGTYVTDDPDEVAALESYDPVKRITLADADEQRKATARQAKATPKSDRQEG